MTTIAVKNWERFQHYKDRDPPWIKLYRDLLTSEPWVLGTDLSRLIQVAITLLAARYQNAIPYQFRMLKKVGSFDCTEKQFSEAIKFLESVNFLEVQSLTSVSNVVAQDASSVLATCNTEGEAEKRERESREDLEAEGDAREAPPNSVPDLNLKAWERWKQYRTEIRKPLKPASIEAAQKQLAAYGGAQMQVVEQSIANGWQGLFELKVTNGSGHRKPTAKAKSIAELEAEEAARVQH
jgi:hypothetical protein